jgi:hypothetical protein
MTRQQHDRGGGAGKQSIAPLNIQTLEIAIRGTAPLVIHRFSKKAEIMQKMAEGGPARSKKNRGAREYEAEAEAAKHISSEGWEGINAAAFRCASISACRLVNFKMTMAKLCIFVVADGYDQEEGSPLVRIYGSAKCHTAHVRNATGVIDVRSRPMYPKWGCLLRVRYDADHFTASDIRNLINRVGAQVGIGEGRADSKDGPGCGYGFFELVPSGEYKQFRKEYAIQ